MVYRNRILGDTRGKTAQISRCHDGRSNTNIAEASSNISIVCCECGESILILQKNYTGYCQTIVVDGRIYHDAMATYIMMSDTIMYCRQRKSSGITCKQSTINNEVRCRTLASCLIIVASPFACSNSPSDPLFSAPTSGVQPHSMSVPGISERVSRFRPINGRYLPQDGDNCSSRCHCCCEFR